MRHVSMLGFIKLLMGQLGKVKRYNLKDTGQTFYKSSHFLQPIEFLYYEKSDHYFDNKFSNDDIVGQTGPLIILTPCSPHLNPYKKTHSFLPINKPAYLPPLLKAVSVKVPCQ